MTGIRVTGLGAVSPAGWGVPELFAAVREGRMFEKRRSDAPGCRGAWHETPPWRERPPWAAHPRLRRASPISHYATAAALEALGGRTIPGGARAGIVVCVMSGGVQYSRRFHDEVLRNPREASPLLFPETVYNAAASHVGTVLGLEGMNYTLVGDPSVFVDGLATAAAWIASGVARGVLVLGAEEPDWLSLEAWALLEDRVPASAGAGAVWLEASEDASAAAVVEALVEPVPYGSLAAREEAVLTVARELGPGAPGEWLVDARSGACRYDRAEDSAWADWRGRRISPKRCLGEGFAAGSAWQCVVACELIRREIATAAVVSAAGLNMGAAGVRFSRAAGEPPASAR